MQHEQGKEWTNRADINYSSHIDHNDFNLCKKTAEQGNVDAQRVLADYYSQGKGVEKDDTEAVNWYKKAAEQGDFLAKLGLANCYFYGNGVEQNYSQAVKLYEQVATQVLSDYSTDKSYIYFLRQTQAQVQYQLGNCYHTGNGVKKDPVQAFGWFQKAAEQNNVDAKVMLAECYLEGNGVAKDLAQGTALLEDATEEQKNPSSQLRLAIRFLFGKKVKQNRTRAIELFEKAAELPGGLRWLKPEFDQAHVQAKTILGICYYGDKNYDAALDCFKYASEERNDSSVGYLWLACIYQLKNKQQFEGLNIERDKQPWWHPIHSESLHAKYQQQDICKLLCKAATGFFFKDDGYDYSDSNIIDFIFTPDVVCFLENQSFSPANVILAFYYRCKEEQEKTIDCLEQASALHDTLANYLLGKHYKDKDCFDRATDYFKKIDEDRLSKFSPTEEKKSTESGYPLYTKDFLAYSAKEELGNIKHQNEIEEKNKRLEEINKHLEEAQKKLIELVQNTSHLAGNLLRPNTQEKIAKRLKNTEFTDESKKLYYASSDIKYVKQQFKLLEIMQSLTGSEVIRTQVKLDQMDKFNNQSISIEDILNLAAFRAIDKLFDTNEYSLNFARETIEEKQGDFSKLSNEYQKYVLTTTDSGNISIISWCSDNLRPITINYKCDDWKKIFFHNNSQSVALFFCYFFELFFNAFKYADHNDYDFLTITLGSEVINGNEFLTMIWTNPKSNQTSFGSNKGLNLSASYISLLNDDKYKDKSQELIVHSDNIFELITRIDRKIFNLK